MNFTFGMLKPDSTEKSLEEEIFALIEKNGLRISLRKKIRLSQDQIDRLYVRNIDKDFFASMSEFLMSEDVTVYVATGEDALAGLNLLVGSTDPLTANEGTIRQKYGVSVTRNIAHSSNSEEEFWQEARIFFTEDELSVVC
ncbi:MAG: nucleoside-diphosphate kinase [Candidatus Berkelbacteria bacterium]